LAALRLNREAGFIQLVENGIFEMAIAEGDTFGFSQEFSND